MRPLRSGNSGDYKDLDASLLAQSVGDLSHECARFDSKPISKFHDTSESGINKTTFQLADIGIAVRMGDSLRWWTFPVLDLRRLRELVEVVGWRKAWRGQ